MSLIRPAILQSARRAREVIAGSALVLGGAWVASRGGYLLVPFGLCLAGLGLGWAIMAWRRMRFAQGVSAPGVVEVDEGQIGYLGPDAGGFVAIPDLTELRLIDMRGRRLWQLRQNDGQALLIPVDAAAKHVHCLFCNDSKFWRTYSHNLTRHSPEMNRCPTPMRQSRPYSRPALPTGRPRMRHKRPDSKRNGGKSEQRLS